MTTDAALACPSCSATLVPVDRSGVTIDACPGCRGVWLDRGELDKLVALEQQASDDFYAEMSGRSRGSDDEQGSSGHSKKRRGGFLGDFMDFG
jgi:Zn-finger nucleic acid-binding protein